MSTNTALKTKEEVLLQMIGEIHQLCSETGILYYLEENNKKAYSYTIRMTATSMNKFLEAYKGDTEERALEWMGNNYRFIGTQLRYVDKGTLYYTEDRFLSEKNLGMYIDIDLINPSKSKLNQFENYWKQLHYSDSDKRSGLLNAAAGKMHQQLLKKSKGKIKKSDLTLVNVEGVEFYVLNNSKMAAEPKKAFYENIKRKPNTESFICDEGISYQDIDWIAERHSLKKINKKMIKSRMKFKKGDDIRLNDVNLTKASVCRYNCVTQLLSKYDYDEILNNSDKPEIKEALDRYVAEAKRLRSKGFSAYIGEKFTKVINAVYPKLDTKDLYKFTPELYKEGIKVYDYKGEHIKTYGGIDE